MDIRRPGTEYGGLHWSRRQASHLWYSQAKPT